MGVILRNHHLIKSLLSNPNFRHACRSITSSTSSGHNYNLVSDNFLVNHFCSKTKTYYFSALSTEKLAPLHDFRSPYFERIHRVSGSCDGLLHLWNADGEDLLWRPSTNEFKHLPPSEVGRPPNAAMISTHCGGFGFDSKSRDYKVVRFVTNFLEDEEGSFRGCNDQFEIYSLKNDSWKEILMLGHIDPLPYVNINGCCYWRSCDGNIISFDFANESFSCFPGPQIDSFSCFPEPQIGKFMGWDLVNLFELLEFDGSLGVIVYSRPEETKNSFELWVWNNRCWTREFKITLVGAQRPLWLSSDAHYFFLQGISGHLLVYDFRTQQLNKLNHYSDYLQVVRYPHNMLPAQWKIRNI